MSEPSRKSILDDVFEQYLCCRRSLGRLYVGEESALRSCARFVSEHGASDLDAQVFDNWCRSFSTLKAVTRRGRQRAVRNACLYRRRSEAGCFVPDITRFPRSQPHCAPIILTPPQVGRLIQLATQLKATNNSPLYSKVARLALVLLFTAGLRRGELTRLTLADVDTEAGLIRIRESKFHKSRTVPLSPGAVNEMRKYMISRLQPPFDTTTSSALLCNLSRGQRGYTGEGLWEAIHKLLVQSGIRDPDGRIPRVHDFRHSFAIQALLRWYRQGADVQTNLPKLALYMGHVSIVSTAYYLRWIPELQEIASTRFEEKFGYLIQGELQ